MAVSAISAEVDFHSHKHCFIFVDGNCANGAGYDELQFFELRQSDVTKQPIYVSGYALRHADQRSITRPRVIINGVFANVLGIKMGDQVLVTRLQEPRTCHSVVAVPVSSDDWEAVSLNAEKIEEQLLEQLRVAYVGLEFPFWVDGGYCLFIRLESFDCGGLPYGLLAEDTEVTVAPKVATNRDQSSGLAQVCSGDQSDEFNDYQSAFQLLRGVRCFDAVLDELLLLADIVLSPSNPIFIGQPLITGSIGTGKTTVAKAFCHEAKTRKLISYSCIVDCKQLKGKAVESVEKRLKEKISDAVNSQPAVIVLDDIDCLCAAGAAMEQITPGVSMLYARMSRMLGSLLRNIRQRRQRVLFLGTCVSAKSINPSLVSPRGVRLFDVIADIPDLALATRKAILCHLIQPSKSSQDLLTTASVKNTLSWVARHTEGYVLADLAALAERAMLAMESVGPLDGPYPRMADFKAALDGFVPLAVTGAGSVPPADGDVPIHLEDIGGLGEAKTVLEKLLLLPTKYPKVFSTLPIRLPRGVLLYGPSGCGKTMLAAAVAKDYNLNLINVKGAELLSKYIGASEQAVRNTLHRAKAMKPCMVFFDEFDALAPRRGHDSTGVTDRVVNQLLTELDGVESLEGVFVLAASSRPDLIDPALLRPGRIDKRVYCGMPSQADRLDILQRVSKPLRLHADVDLPVIASLTDGFSGADLKRLLLESYLLAVREAVDGERGAVTITQIHILQILQSLAPSVSQQERMRFEKLCEAFQGGLDDRATATSYQEGVGKRATLA